MCTQTFRGYRWYGWLICVQILDHTHMPTYNVGVYTHVRLTLHTLTRHTKRWTNVGLMLGQRRRRWAIIKAALIQRVVCILMPYFIIQHTALLAYIYRLLGMKGCIWLFTKWHTPFHIKGDDDYTQGGDRVVWKGHNNAPPRKLYIRNCTKTYIY